MASVSLTSLVQALSGAVVSAQAELARSQVLDIGRYFDEKTRKPRMLVVRLPSLNPADAGRDVDVGVPLLTLHSPAQMRIKEIEFQFEVDFGDFGASQSDTVSVAEGVSATAQTLNVNPQTRAGQSSTPSRVVMKIEAVDQGDGLGRLIAELNKLYGPIDPPGSTPPSPAQAAPPPVAPAPAQ